MAGTSPLYTPMIRSNSLVLSPGFARPLARHLTSLGVGGVGGGVPIVNNGVLAPFVTFTRASEGTYFDLAGTQQTAAVNEPRIDYDPVTGELRGLLIEPQRTNLLLRSQELDNASWTKVGATITPNTAVAPDGTLTADLLIEDTSLGGHGVDQAVSTSAGAVTVSLFVKYGGRQWIRLDPYGASSPGTDAVWFDLLNGVKGQEQANATGTITAIAGGWYRITWTATCLGSTLNVSLRCVSADGSTSNYTGDGVSGVYVWGFQCEAGPFATSYIPTAGTTQTRAADVASVTDLSSFGFNASEGTIVTEYSAPPHDEAVYPGVMSLHNSGDTTQNIQIFASAGVKALRVGVRSSGGNTEVTTLAGYLPGAVYRTAAAYRDADSAGCTGGANPVAIGVSPLPAGVNTMSIGTRLGNTAPSNMLCGHIRHLRYYPRRLSNAQLQALTA